MDKLTRMSIAAVHTALVLLTGCTAPDNYDLRVLVCITYPSLKMPSKPGIRYFKLGFSDIGCTPTKHNFTAPRNKTYSFSPNQKLSMSSSTRFQPDVESRTCQYGPAVRPRPASDPSCSASIETT
ncbi:hypothetical protein B0J17DRAFT_655283 [Rhizoctonia solani]|nr:hypothetical protein B0J17DRAFT_655283 [Rhizoctonia solani]